MNEIECISVIERSKLNQKIYFTSLLEEAYNAKLLSEDELEKIQLDCIDLLSYKAKRYTDNDSSSIRIELAENIMASNLYTIGLFLKTFPIVDDAVKAMTATSMLDLYLSGRKIIDSMINSTKRKHLLVIKNILDNDNHFYKPTVVAGIKGFFKKYNANYGAHENIITADYPLYNQIENLSGIEFIQKYVESIYLENMFCQCFSSEAIHALLCGFDDRYQHLVFNIFDKVLTCAIGCTILNINPVQLSISTEQSTELQKFIHSKTDEEISDIVTINSQKLLSELQITNKALKRYIDEALPKLITHICFMKKNNLLDKVFISPKYPQNTAKLRFSASKKMDNYMYSEILDELMQCDLISEKVNIIKSSINSLIDLEDIIFDASLTDKEITAVLKTLKLPEITVLAKRHPLYASTKAIDITESEQTFRKCLDDYILSLSAEKQNKIKQTMDLLEDTDI